MDSSGRRDPHQTKERTGNGHGKTARNWGIPCDRTRRAPAEGAAGFASDSRSVVDLLRTGGGLRRCPGACPLLLIRVSPRRRRRVPGLPRARSADDEARGGRPAKRRCRGSHAVAPRVAGMHRLPRRPRRRRDAASREGGRRSSARTATTTSRSSTTRAFTGSAVQAGDPQAPHVSGPATARIRFFRVPILPRRPT